MKRRERKGRNRGREGDTKRKNKRKERINSFASGFDVPSERV